MQSGQLNRRIQIQSQSTSQDAYGQPVSTWTTAYTCWASIDVQNSQLVYATAEFIGKITHRISFRWTSSQVFKPNMRIVYTDASTGVVHTYNIEALLNVEQKNVEIIALCYELAGAE